MAAVQRMQPIDIATGVISGTLAAVFFTLAVVATTPDQQPPAPPRVDSAVSSTQR